MTSVSASEYNDGSVPSVQHVMRKTFIVARHEEQRLGTTHLSTNDDDFEWMRIVPHSIESDISSKSPSNDDPDFVEQLLQTSIAIDGGTRSRTRSPTFGPSGQMATSSKSPTTTASFPLHSAMPTEQASAIPTRGEVTIDVNATQVVTTAPPTAASSPFTTADEPTGIPTLRSTEPPTSSINVTASSDESSISLSQVPTISKPTGIPTTSSTAPSELGSSQHNQKHDRDGHVSNNDDETPSYIGEVNGGDDDVLRVDLPRIICDMTLSPRLLQQTLERKHVLVTTMTDMIHDLFDAHLRKPIYDLRNISLTVEVKWNEDENLDPEVRMHAHYRGSSFFSPGTSPTRDDLTDLLVRYFDVDEFTARLMLHWESRGDGSVVVVNSVHFTLEDGTLIQAGIEDEENALPNNAGAPTGQGMQVLLLSGVIGKRVIIPIYQLLFAIGTWKADTSLTPGGLPHTVMACLLALTTFLWPRGDDEEDAIGGASSRSRAAAACRPFSAVTTSNPQFAKLRSRRCRETW